MCRVILATHDAIMEYDKRHGLLKLLDHLEKQCGGQGNGLTLESGSGNLFTKKGVNMKIEECAALMLDRLNMYKRAVFHTRIASVADVSDDRCHPFYFGSSRHDGAREAYMNGKYSTRVRGAACMNGTMYSAVSGIADSLGITDSEVILKTLNEETTIDFVEGLSATKQVWVGIIDGKEFAVKGDGALQRYKLDCEGYFYASSFPTDVTLAGRVDPLLEGYVWFDGEVLREGRQPYKYTYAKGGTSMLGFGSGKHWGEDLDDEYSYWKSSYVKDSSTPEVPAWYGDTVRDDGVDEVVIPDEFAERNADAYLAGYDQGYDDALESIEDHVNPDTHPILSKAIDDSFEEGWSMGYKEGANTKKKGGR